MHVLTTIAVHTSVHAILWLVVLHVLSPVLKQQPGNIQKPSLLSSDDSLSPRLESKMFIQVIHKPFLRSNVTPTLFYNSL